MIINSFKGERLKKARLYRFMTLTDLAKKTDLSKQALSQYENEITTPIKSNIFALANALSFPIDYFLINTSKPYSIKQSEATYFRSLLSTSKRDRLAQTIRLEFIAQIYDALNSFVNFPKVDLPQFCFTDYNQADEVNELRQLEEITQRIRQLWGLGNEPIKDLKYVLEEHGIIVTCTDLKSDKIDAFSQRTCINNNEIYIIVIAKERKSISRARFDMAHELAHILLHPWSEDLETIPKDEFKTREKQANMFASALLLPYDSFGADISRNPKNLDFYFQLKKKWAVSVKAMIYRTHTLGIITTTTYQFLMRQYAKNGWNSGEPDDLPYSPKSTLLGSAVEFILKEGALSIDGLLSAFKRNGLVLNPSEIEELLYLKAGTLISTTTKKGVLLTLKNNTT